MDPKSAANNLLKAQVVIINDIVRNDPSRSNVLRRHVRGTVHLVDRVPPLLIAIDLFWRPDGSEWPDWRRITRWQDEDLSGHPWSQRPMSVAVGESRGQGSSTGMTQQGERLIMRVVKEEEDLEIEGEKERRRKREGKRKADECKHIASAAHKTRPPTTHPPSDEDEVGDDTSAAVPVAATTAPPPTARPARASSGTQRDKGPRDPSPAPAPHATSSLLTRCTTCIHAGDVCVSNPNSSQGVCKGCRRRKKRCSLRINESSRVPSRSPASARSRPQSTAPPPNLPIIVVKSLPRSDSPQLATASPPKMLKTGGPPRGSKLEVDSSAPPQPRTESSVAGPSRRSRSKGKPSQQRRPASRAIAHPPTRPTTDPAYGLNSTEFISRDEHERLFRELHERHHEAAQGRQREYREVISRINTLEQRMAALRLQAAGASPAIGDGGLSFPSFVHPAHAATRR
ncbi:hypothetical protein J3R82DRAFT_3708 [Butyriboletus roseoflavus]|nr:hypothetical protein J3R82DRAFT_3708 [Butyriboletus roseoflavus]